MLLNGMKNIDLINHLSANSTKWSNTLKQFVGNSDEIRKIESSFLSKIYINKLYNHCRKRGLKIIPVLRKTISCKWSR